jgi:hypothetical protein
MEKMHARKHEDLLSQPPDDIDECKQSQTHASPWSIKESLLRGVLDTILAAVGYLLYVLPRLIIHSLQPF